MAQTRDGNITRGNGTPQGSVSFRAGMRVIFENGDGDGDKILSTKVGGAGTGKHSPPHPHPVPNIYIYNIIKYYK